MQRTSILSNEAENVQQTATATATDVTAPTPIPNSGIAFLYLALPKHMK